MSQTTEVTKKPDNGAGIIDSGYDAATGVYYDKYSNGTLEIWGTKQSTSDTSSTNRTYNLSWPATLAYLSASSYVVMYCEQGPINGRAFTAYRSHDGSATTISVSVYTVENVGIATTGYGNIDFHIIGRWK